MISAVDSAVGDIVNTLKQSSMFENTVLVFSSDNGVGTVNIYFCSFRKKNYGFMV